MKITCQACQSKYTIADDKIQGKVAKIRCKKCGATVLVDASVSSSGETPLAQSDVAQGGAGNVAGAGMWSVAIGEGEPRTMTLQEVVDAYNTGAITSETYVWKDGMGDWLMLAQCDEIASVLRGAAKPTPADPEKAIPVARPSQTDAAATAKNGSSGSTAVRRDPARARAGDIFAGGSEDEEIATSVPPNVVARAASAAAARSAAAATSSATSGAAASTATSTASPGARDEQSLLFSLSALTSTSAGTNGSSGSGASPRKSSEDSGLIDLNALAKAQETHKSSEASEMSAMASPLFPTPFLFPAALGTPELPPEEVDVPHKKKSKAPIIAVAGTAVLGIAVAIAVLSSRGPESSAATVPPPEVTVAPPPPEPTPTQTAEPAPAPTPTQSAKKAAPAPGRRKSPGGSTGAEPGGPPAAPAQPAGPQRGKCGCLSSDLQCQIRCSATGK